MPKPGPRSTYRYSAAFKATAVRVSQLPGLALRARWTSAWQAHPSTADLLT
jgi:hypothetical protein